VPQINIKKFASAHWLSSAALAQRLMRECCYDDWNSVQLHAPSDHKGRGYGDALRLRIHLPNEPFDLAPR